jgi:hypothetical protein
VLCINISKRSWHLQIGREIKKLKTGLRKSPRYAERKKNYFLQQQQVCIRQQQHSSLLFEAVKTCVCGFEINVAFFMFLNLIVIESNNHLSIFTSSAENKKALLINQKCFRY